MELIARNFECFPVGLPANALLRPLIAGLKEVRFPVTVGERNSNQLAYHFDRPLKCRMLARGAVEATLDLPPETRAEYDFVLTLAGKQVVVEVEKSNWNKILYDFLKFHMYFRNGADFSILFLPKNWPHAHGEENAFDIGLNRYKQCLDFGFGTSDLFDRILIVGY